jgi:NAD(P)-dependent dehydrogenase (short-subunit alcohol dehydrogenase family)
MSAPGRLADTIAVVTGGTRGAGEAIAARFAAEGAQVAILGRNVERGTAVVDQIRAAGGEVMFIAADVAVEDDVARAIGAAAEAFGRIDVLVNNAAPTDLVTSAMDRPVVDQTTEDFDRIVKVSLYGTFWCCKYAIPHMQPGGRAAIINISSITSIEGQSSVPSYSAAKGAINSLTRQLAVEYASAEIRVNTLLFGAIDNERLQSVPIPGLRDALRRQQLTRLVTVEDTAHAALFLASQESACVTGQMLVLDGGAFAKGAMPMDDIVAAGQTPAQAATH